MQRSLQDWDQLIEVRAIRLVRIHLRGRKTINDVVLRKELHTARDHAFDLLVRAVEGRDREFARHEQRMADFRRKEEARIKRKREARNRKARAIRQRLREATESREAAQQQAAWDRYANDPS